MMRTLILLFLPLAAAAADTRLVRETEALTPEAERAALHVPAGFEVQLFASEPMINKPINIAMDARGRVWVSSTVEYPYAAGKSRWSDAQGTRVKDSRDAIKILEDTDGDGRADKVTNFADGLNIPTGVLPWQKPEHKAGCIAFSIPNIWYFADTDGDDIADVREVLFGPLGYEKDTHGMCSSFRLGLDGWVYATHGFNNTSHFKAKNGGTLDLHSGNVFRFRPDGSAVEKYTSGQVNPFGLAWDRYGNLYSADCHSSPVYQLIRGACYPSFGKPHDGLGFAPVMCQHTHGSTGICGIVYIDGGIWGPEWDDHILLGNVVTSRVNHDHVTFTGSTPKANERPDFITSDDPWFRPVDLTLGTDNALYIADFYNKIIGHYEVPLDHPGRDRESGRIWRVVKKGERISPPSTVDPDSDLIQRLRQLEAGPPLKVIPRIAERNPFQTPEDSPRVMLARARALRNIAPDANLRAEALFHLYMIGIDHSNDATLYQTCLIGQRSLFFGVDGLVDQLPYPGSLLPSVDFPAHLENLLVTLPRADASSWIIKYESHLPQDLASKTRRLKHIARHGDPSLLPQAIALAKKASLHNSTPPLPLLTALHEGLSERGAPPSPEMLSWAQDLAKQMLDETSQKPTSAWTSTGNAKWSLVSRSLADGREATILQSMAKGGGDEESRTGVLKSKPFPAPAKLTLWINGHRGHPTALPHDKNLVRIVESDTSRELARVFPPRDDKAKKEELDLSAHAGKSVCLEIIDGDSGKAYAWLGVTGIEPAVVSANEFESKDTLRESLKTLAVMLQHSAPAALRERLAEYLPPRPAPPPLPVSPEQRKQLDELIAARTAAFARAKPDLEVGANVFKMTCAACHQIGGEGGLIGPQLDGIGARGVARLCEDILDPNRNVDAHFHLHTLSLKDGTQFSGFLKAEAGQVLILADAAGQERRVSKSDLSKDQVTPLSLMPSTFGQTLGESDFMDLLGYLLQEKAAL